MWQISWRDLKDRKWSLIIYSLASLLLLLTYVATFTSSQAATVQLAQLYKSFPKALLDLMGLNNMTMNTIESYLNMKHFSLLWPLMALFLAVSRAGNQLAGEIENGTMGLLLSLPVKRGTIYAAKFLSGLIVVIIFTFVSVFGVVPLAAAYHIPTHPHILLKAWLLTALFMAAIYSAAMAVSAFADNKGRVYAIMGALLAASYTANVVALISDRWSALKNYSIFYYFDTAKVLTTGQISHRSIIVFGTIILLGALIGAWRFVRRDVLV